MADLKSELSGDLARLILGLMMPPAHYDAKQLKKAMEVRVGTRGRGAFLCRCWSHRCVGRSFLVEPLPHLSWAQSISAVTRQPMTQGFS